MPPPASEELVALPSFGDLPTSPAAPPQSSWGLWGENDRCGALNLATPDRVLRAAALVSTGRVVPLDLAIDLVDPPLFGRARTSRVVSAIGPAGAAFDEELLAWNLQTTTQWDGFGHIAEPGVGSYNGLPHERHGVDAWSHHGIVTRGVLADLARWRADRGIACEPMDRGEIAADELRAVLEQQEALVEPGDVLLIRTGWVARYRELSNLERHRLADGPGESLGLSASQEMVALLWDLHVSAVAADNPSLEAWPPPSAPSEQRTVSCADDMQARSLHRSLLARLGVPIGEMFDLDELATCCATRGRYDFCFVSVPLNIPHDSVNTKPEGDPR
jgi:kynurenine formamidase